MYAFTVPGTGGNKAPSGTVGTEIGFQRRPGRHINMGPVVQPGSAQMLLVQRKAQRFYEMKTGARACAQSGDIPGIRRNFGMIQNDMEHGYFSENAAELAEYVQEDTSVMRKSLRKESEKKRPGFRARTSH